MAFLTEYSDATMKAVSERRCSPEAAEGYPRDAMLGAGAVETTLGRLLGMDQSHSGVQMP